MTTAVLLMTRDGVREFVKECHVHGVRDGRLLLASGEPGAGLDAKVTREIDLSDLHYAETVEHVSEASEKEGNAHWTMGHGPSDGRPRGRH